MYDDGQLYSYPSKETVHKEGGYSSIYLKTVDQKNEDLGFSQQFYHQFSCNSQEFTNQTPLNEKTLIKVYSFLCLKIEFI